MTLAAEDITQNQFIKLGHVPSVSFYVLHHATPFHISLPHHAAPYHAAPFHISKPHLAAVRYIDIHAPCCSFSYCSLTRHLCYPHAASFHFSPALITPLIPTRRRRRHLWSLRCLLYPTKLLPNTPPMLSSCCFLPFFPSPYHSPDPYQEEKEKLFRLLFLTTYCPLMLLMLPILEKPRMLLVLVMIYWLSGEILLLNFFSSKDVQFARVIQLRPTVKNYNCPKYTNPDTRSFFKIFYIYQ